MRMLFEIDRKDYTEDMPLIRRECVRAVIRQEGSLLVQKSSRGEYKIPGGGVEDGETDLETLRREVLEETGYQIDQDSVTEIGEVIEKRRDVFAPDTIYLLHTRFYGVDVVGEQDTLTLTPEEKEKGYTAVWESAEQIIRTNEAIQKEHWRRRDTLFLKWMIAQGTI